MAAFGALGAVLVLALVILVIVLAILAILMPLFVYQIKNYAKEATTELRTLSTNVGHLLATTQAQVQMPSPPAPTPAALPPTTTVPRERKSKEVPYKLE